MSDIGATSQELFTARQGELVEQLMQACAMHHLSSHCVLPIAYMADIRFQQVTFECLHTLHCCAYAGLLLL